MDLKYITYPEYKKEIKKLYIEAFKKKERFPFWIIKHSLINGKSTLNAIVDNDKFIGMIYIVDCDDLYYLMYFAINENFRNKNYGAKVLNDLIKKYGTIFLSIEKPMDELSKRRKKFYLRNGFFETNKYCSEAGIDYEILCSNKHYNITKEIHKKRYSNMIKSKIIKFYIYISIISLGGDLFENRNRH